MSCFGSNHATTNDADADADADAADKTCNTITPTAADAAFLYETEPDAPMYLMDMQDFCQAGKFLRQDRALQDGKLLRYRDLTDADKAKCMIVFISHRWLNADSDRPDSDQNVKFQLTKMGLDMLKRQSGGAVRILVWLDYSCMNQLDRVLMASGIASLPAYVERSSVLLSPILPNEYYTPHELKEIQSLDNHLMMKLTEHMSPEHRDMMRNYAHLLDMTSRGWIRLEEFLASNIPFHGRAGLQYDFFGRVGCHRKDRPHFLVTPDLNILDPLIVLPRLSNETARLLDPVNGKLFKTSDVHKIQTALDVVMDHVDLSTEEVYEGDMDEMNRPHGTGRKTYSSGAIYDGEWKHGNRHGKGKFFTSNGNRYVGDWYDDKMHGQGILTYVFGDYHEGRFEHDHRSGKGSYVYTNGCAYYGSWKNSVPCDPNAYYTMPDGTPFESEQAALDYMAALSNVNTIQGDDEGATPPVTETEVDDCFQSKKICKTFGCSIS